MPEEPRTSPIQHITRYVNYYVVGAMVLGMVLRLIRVQSRGIWYDDAFSILLSERSLSEIIMGTAADTMPPLSYFLLHFWMYLGNSIWFIRLLNILLSLGVIWMTYQWVSEMGGKPAGLFTAFWLAVSPFQIFHAQEIRMYILLELGIIGSYWFFYRIWSHDPPRKGDWAGYIAFGAMALYCHNLAVFSLIVVDLFLLIQRRWKLILPAILSQFGMAVLFVPWLLFVPGQIDKIQTAFWTPRPGLVEIIQAMDTLIGSLPQPAWLIGVITVFSLQVIVLVFWQIWKHRKEPIIQYLGVLVLTPGVLLFILSYVMRPVFVPRAMIASGVCFYGLSAILLSKTLAITGVDKAKRDSAPIILSGFILVVSIISLPYQYLFSEFPRSPFLQLTDKLNKLCPVDTCLVLHDNKLSYFPAYVYNRGLNQKFIADQPGSFNDTLAPDSQQAIQQYADTEVESAVDTYRHIYFVTFQKALDEYTAVGMETHPTIEALTDLGFDPGQEINVGDLRVFEYQR